MQLKTVEQVIFDHYKNTKLGISNDQHLFKAITQDRADIRDVLREGVEGTKRVQAIGRKGGKIIDYTTDTDKSYNEALTEVLTLIDTLLPGNVSK